VDGSGAVSSCLANAIITLEYHPDWLGVLGHDENAGETACTDYPPFTDGTYSHSSRPCPIPWTDLDEVRTAYWLQMHNISVSREIVNQAVQVVASHHPFHPIRDYLTALIWDGEERIPYWLTACLGVENDSDYITAVSARFLIAAVARILSPGCKVDTCLVLEGKQGKLKSTALRVLVTDKWFTDELPDIRTKDAAIQLRGKWLIELGEMGALKGMDMERIKSFLSRSVDRYRPVHGRASVDVPRQGVFAGSVNHGQYLHDETGGRRFWPVITSHIDLALLAEWRDQLWAEAVHRYIAGAKWWLWEDDLVTAARTEQAARYQADPWEAKIVQHTFGRPIITLDEIFAKLEKPFSDRSQGDSNRIVRCLVALGYEKVRARIGGRMGRRECQYRLPV